MNDEQIRELIVDYSGLPLTLRSEIMERAKELEPDHHRKNGQGYYCLGSLVTLQLDSIRRLKKASHE